MIYSNLAFNTGNSVKWSITKLCSAFKPKFDSWSGRNEIKIYHEWRRGLRRILIRGEGSAEDLLSDEEEFLKL